MLRNLFVWTRHSNEVSRKICGADRKRGAMDKYQELFSEQDHYDDGIVVDYATMIRMWCTLDRSVASFNRDCGIITLKPTRDGTDVPIKK